MCNNNCGNCLNWDNTTPYVEDITNDDPNVGRCEALERVLGIELDDRAQIAGGRVDYIFTPRAFTCILHVKDVNPIPKAVLRDWDNQLKNFTVDLNKISKKASREIRKEMQALREATNKLRNLMMSKLN